ncbi:MAG: thioredoxin [Dehalococcoidia bacterium]|nr:thioredoxin [Dehalococcoidia bacterium]
MRPDSSNPIGRHTRLALLRSGALLLVVAIATFGSGCAVARLVARSPAAPSPVSETTVVPGGVTTMLVSPRGALDGPYPRYRDLESGLGTVLGTPDLGVGRGQRVSFVLSDAEGLVRLPVLQFDLYQFSDGPTGPSGPAVAHGVAKFHSFPGDSRGLYSASVDLLTPGTWGLGLRVPMSDGTVATTLFAFEVVADAKAPLVGERAPHSRNRTLADVGSLAELSTGPATDRGLYERSIAAALDAHRPLVVVFASPGFCTNALCGPQVEQLSELHRDYAGAANFVHVDIYENPAAVRARGLDVGVRSPLLAEWGLETDEWTFVIDRAGVVVARFEGFAPRVEVEAALRAIIDRS